VVGLDPQPLCPLDIVQQYMRLSGKPLDAITVDFYDLDAVSTRIKIPQCFILF
jgi:hypothetical protein